MADSATGALSESLADSQWWSADDLEAVQTRLLERLVRHAREHVPFYAKRLDALFTRRGHFNIGGWDDVEPLTRKDVQENFEDLKSRQLPVEAGRAGMVSTSGSTGTPVKVLKCKIQSRVAITASVRFMDWHGIDYTKTFAAIRPFPVGKADYPDGYTHDSRWGANWRDIPGHGPWVDLTVSTPPPLQLEWLQRQCPCYLNTFPVNLLALCEAAEQDPSLLPDIRGVVTLGELVTPHHRERARDILRTRIFDQYTTIECGVLAGECPVSGNMHLHAESMRLDVLDMENEPCATGQEGFACITPLYSYAMPLIKYVMSDLVTLLPPCGCGRGLPHLSIAGGRMRSRFRFSDGTIMAPDFRMSKNAAILGATRWQWAQVGPDELEFRFVSSRNVSEPDYEAMRAHVLNTLKRPVAVRFLKLDDMPLNPSGKHFDYVCELPEA
jgi:phenylacetate-CoA ligase